MRGDIQFEKIEKKSKFKQTLVVCLSFLFLISATFAWVTYAYFTATATVNGEINFGEIAVSFVDSSGNILSNSKFQSKFTQKILPGDTIDLSNVIVKNTGTHSAYVLINANIDIVNDGAETMSYNVWYNINGDEVHTNDFAINQTEPTLLGKNETATTTNINWKVPGEAVTSKYKEGTANVRLLAYGVQTNLEEAKAYVNPNLYASYYICKNATQISQNSGASYTGVNINGEPLRQFSGKNLFNNANYTINTGALAFDISHLEMGEEYTFSTNVAVGWLKISDGRDGYNSVQRTGTFTQYTFTMTRNVNIPEGSTQYLFLGEAGSFYTSIGSVTSKNIQIEKGSAATSYEPYVWAKDTVDYNTMQVTRNVGRTELTGNEEGWWEYSNINDPQGISFVLNIPQKIIGYKTSICSHFENIQASWGEPYKTSQSIYSDHPTHKYIYFRSPLNRPEIDTVGEWQTWLREQYAKGTPVTIWYKLENSATEKVYSSGNLWSLSTTISSNGTNGNSTSILLSTSSISIPSANNVQYTISFNLRANTVNYSETGNLIYFTLEYTDGTLQYVGVTTSNYQNRFVWFTTTAGKTLKSVNYINAHRRFISGTIEIYNIQLEIGASPTDFKAYNNSI